MSLPVGTNGKKDGKLTKKRLKNSTIKPLFTKSIPCMKMQGGHDRPCPPLPTPMPVTSFILDESAPAWELSISEFFGCFFDFLPLNLLLV